MFTTQTIASSRYPRGRCDQKFNVETSVYFVMNSTFYKIKILIFDFTTRITTETIRTTRPLTTSSNIAAVVVPVIVFVVLIILGIIFLRKKRQGKMYTSIFRHFYHDKTIINKMPALKKNILYYFFKCDHCNNQLIICFQPAKNKRKRSKTTHQ